MSASNIIMYLLPIIVTPILSRLYFPEDFGEWGVFSSFIAIVSMGIFLGLDNVIILTPEKNLNDVLSLCIIVSSTLIATIAIIYGVGQIIGNGFVSDFPEPIALFTYLIMYVMYMISYNLCNRYEHYYTLSIANIIRGSSQAIFRILLSFVLICSFNGLIWGTTIAEGLVSLYLIIYLYRIYKKKFAIHFNIGKLNKLLLQYKNFPLYDAPSTILSFAAFNLPIIILSIYFDKASIGCFSIILQLLLIPMSLVGSAIGKVYYQRISSTQDKGSIEATSHEVLRILIIIAIAPLLFIACGGDKLIVLFLGDRWLTAGDMALCLAPWSFPTILTQPLLPLFRVLNKQRIMLFYDFMYFALGIGSVIISCQLTTNLYLILISFSFTCFIIKLFLYLKLLSLSNISPSRYSHIMPLWCLAILILIFRLTQLHIMQ